MGCELTVSDRESERSCKQLRSGVAAMRKLVYVSIGTYGYRKTVSLHSKASEAQERLLCVGAKADLLWARELMSTESGKVHNEDWLLDSPKQGF